MPCSLDEDTTLSEYLPPAAAAAATAEGQHLHIKDAEAHATMGPGSKHHVNFLILIKAPPEKEKAPQRRSGVSFKLTISNYFAFVSATLPMTVFNRGDGLCDTKRESPLGIFSSSKSC